MTTRLLLLGWVALSWNVCSTSSAQAVGWRGDGNGSFAVDSPPEQWSQQQGVVWSVELPDRGYSSPVVCDGRLLLTAEPSLVLCLQASDGSELWRRQAGYAEALGEAKAAEIAAAFAELDAERNKWRQRHNELRKADPESPQLAPLREKMKQADDRRKEFEKQFPQEKRGGAGNAAATTVCDGRAVYAAFSTGVAACFSVDGEPRWIRHVEAPQIGFGHSASPVLAGGHLLVHFQDLVALDVQSGRELWRAEVDAMHGTSVVASVDGEDVVVTPSGALVRAADGEVVARKLFRLSNNSPLVHDGVIYAHESGKVKALALPPALQAPVDVPLLWQCSSTKDQRVASAVHHDGLLYGGGRKGILDVIDAKTGEEVYRQRLDVGELFGGLTVAGGLIYVPGRDGRTLVMRPGRKYEPLAVNQLQRTSCTPFFADGRMYFRSEKRLYCVGR